EEERARLARVFEQRLDRVVGYALPLRREHRSGGDVWVTGPWFLRAEHMFLLPGDSPIGYRLPLDSPPWAAPQGYPYIYERDPMAPLPARPEKHERQRHLAGGAAPRSPRGAGREWPPARGVPDPTVIRSALCVEPRHGRLHVFMPPASYTEDYLDLVSAVE